MREAICRYCGKPILRIVVGDKAFWRHRTRGAGHCEVLRAKSVGRVTARGIAIEPRKWWQR